MDSQLITVDQFASTIATIRESMARLRQKIKEQHALHDQVQDKGRNDPTTLPPPPSIQQTTSHVLLVLHGKVEITPPRAIVPTTSIDDTHTCMDRLEYCVR